MTDDFYRAFEDRFRGSRELIKSRLRIYLPFVEPLKALYDDCTAVDLGCGRGEWLELMTEVGMSTRGVDLDDGMLGVCSERGLDAEKGDAIDYLRGLPAESVSVVSGFHVAEHIPFEALQELVQQARRVLKPVGLLILETPNPENLSVGTSSFYYDPTHERPVPPALLSFLPEYFGFFRTKIIRLQERPGLSDTSNISLFDVLTGVSPDFAVIAQQGAETPEQLAPFAEPFEKDYGVRLEELAARHQARIELLSQNQEKLSQNQEQLSQNQEQLSQDHDLLKELYSSTSWQITAPLRAFATAMRNIPKLFGSSKLHLKIWLKRQLTVADARLTQHPTFRSTLRNILRASPGLRARLARVRRSDNFPLEARGKPLSPGAPTDLDHLPPRTREVFKRLKTAIHKRDEQNIHADRD